LFQNVDAIALVVGDDDYENPYRKTVTLQVKKKKKKGLVNNKSKTLSLVLDMAFRNAHFPNDDSDPKGQDNVCLQSQKGRYYRNIKAG
jgi:hypothetical protein